MVIVGQQQQLGTEQDQTSALCQLRFAGKTAHAETESSLPVMSQQMEHMAAGGLKVC